MKFWSNEETHFIIEEINEGVSDLSLVYEKFCHRFGRYRSYDSVRKKIRAVQRGSRMGIPDLTVSFDTAQDSDDYSPSLETSWVNRQLPPSQWLQDLVRFGSSIKREHHSPQPSSDGGTSQVILLSDTHIGKKTEIFDPDIAVSRLLSTPEILTQTQNLDGVEEIVICLVGDMVDGEDIYATQASHLAMPAIEQVQLCTETLWEMAHLYRSQFNIPIRFESVPGNHGRVSKTANEKTNWDNVLYYTLGVMVNMYKEPNIRFTPNYEQSCVIEVQDKRGMLNHKGVKHTGTPAMQVKIAGWNYTNPFDFLLHGHWHQWYVGSWVNTLIMSNGCLPGPDDLSHQMAKENNARQGHFKVTAGRPIHSIGFFEWEV